MKLPESIRVAAFDIKVIEWDHLTASVQEAHGEFSGSEGVIRVDASINRLQVLDTLLHEINHAIYWAYGIAGEDDEERTVSVMATAWLQIYRDNPTLLRLLSRVLRSVG